MNWGDELDEMIHGTRAMPDPCWIRPLNGTSTQWTSPTRPAPIFFEQ